MEALMTCALQSLILQVDMVVESMALDPMELEDITVMFLEMGRRLELGRYLLDLFQIDV
jgi:hypothetical protein